MRQSLNFDKKNKDAKPIFAPQSIIVFTFPSNETSYSLSMKMFANKGISEV
jgi:hypothetical protein